MRRASPSRFVTGLALAAVLAPAGAASADPDEVVITGTRTPESTHRATVRVEVVTREEAERRGATNVAEALQGQLGVQVNASAYGFLGGPSAIQIQGFDLDRILVLEDGERVIGDVGGAIDLAQIPLTDVSRIEVVAGPMSALYGTSAIGGVINIVTAPPQVDGPSGRARLEYRSRHGVVAQGNGAYRRGRGWAIVDASYQRQDGIPVHEGQPDLAVPDLASCLLGVRGGWRLSDKVGVEARARWIRDVSNGREDMVAPGLGTYRVDLPETTDRFILHGVETIDLGKGSNVRLSLARQWAFDTQENDRYQSPLDQTRRRADVLTSFEGTATLADGPRTWVFGGRAEAEQLDQTYRDVELVGGAPSARTTTEVPTMTLGSGALYAQLAYKLLGDRLTIMPGARAEMHVRYGGVVAPRLALAYQPTSDLTLRVSGGRGFRAPTAKEFGFSFDHSVYGYKVIGNPDLVPETSWGVSADVAYRPEKGTVLRAGVFGNWIHQLIDTVLVPGATVAGVDTYAYQNIGAARTFGVQVDGRTEPAPWLRAEGGYAYLWTRDDTDQHPLASRPPHTVYAALTAQLPFRFEITARWRGVSSAYVDSTSRTPSYSLLDGRLARPLLPARGSFPRLIAYAGVLDALDIHKDPDLPGDQRPLSGRTLYAGLTAEAPSENEP